MTSSELKGLSGMKLDQLIQKCKDLDIQAPPKPTRGLLMRMIRDGVPATPNELVSFGRYRRYRYCEVPMSYLDWAIDECHNNENHSPDLARLVKWAKENKGKATSSAGISKPKGYRDPEEVTRKAPPPAELPPKSCLPAAKGSKEVKPKTKSTPRKKGRASSSDEEDYSMVTDPEKEIDHERILDLEKTVLELKAQIDAAKNANTGSR